MTSVATSLPVIDLVVLVVYLAAMVAMEIWLGHKNTLAESIHEGVRRNWNSFVSSLSISPATLGRCGLPSVPQTICACAPGKSAHI